MTPKTMGAPLSGYTTCAQNLKALSKKNYLSYHTTKKVQTGGRMDGLTDRKSDYYSAMVLCRALNKSHQPEKKNNNKQKQSNSEMQEKNVFRRR